MSTLSEKTYELRCAEVQALSRTPLSEKFWLPRFGLSPADFLALVRFWLELGYEVYDWSMSPITLQSRCKDILEGADFHRCVTESAGGVHVFVFSRESLVKKDARDDADDQSK